MAYFPNGTAGYGFDEQCSHCRYGEGPCPIWRVQNDYNYKACNNEIASAILNDLVKDDGTCMMFEHDPKTFELPEAPPMAQTYELVLDELEHRHAA